MDPIKRLYIEILTVLLVLLAGCFIESVVKRSKIALSLAHLSITSFLSIVFFASAILTKNKGPALILYLLYYGMLDVSVMAVLFLVYTLEEKELKKNDKILIGIFFALCILDIGLDFYFGLTKFNIIPLYRNNSFYCWQVSYFNPYFRTHEVICHSMFLFITVKLVIDAVKTPAVFRMKYITILILLTIEVSLNAMYITNPWVWKIDYSLVFYGLCVIIVYSFITYILPKNVNLHMLSIANETISDSVICFDNREICIYANKNARKIYHGPDTDWIQDYIYSPEDEIKETLFLNVDEEDRVYDLEFHRIRDKEDRYSGSYFKLNDRTLEIKKIEKEEYRATHDELTGLYSRNYFFSEMERILHAKPDVPRCLVCTDLVNFKLVNDIFGSKFGDEILKKQAEMLSLAQFPGVVIGRISGDKFAMLIEKSKFNPERAVTNTNHIREISKNIKFPLKIKIGVYEISNSFENVHTMYDKAYMAIKNNDDSQNKILSYYDMSLMNKLIHEKNIIGQFKYAVKSNQFFMFLQPQVNAKTGKCVGSEALVRWYDIDKGYRQPGDFIPILEKSGLIYKLDYYIWEKAIQTLSRWKEAGITDTYISVNISARDFYFADLYQIFASLVEKYNVTPKMVNLEITESVLIDNKSLHKTVLRRLQEYGFRIEMDDFGSGYSSLNVLKDISMDVLKIDMGFLRQTENEKRGQYILRSVVKMAHSLGMEIVCEGVETPTQRTFLTDIGVDIFQGYLFSKPIPVQEFEHKFMEVKE